MKREVEYYFQRFGFCGRQINVPPPDNLGIVVVIPCYDEPDLIGSLKSVWNCEAPDCPVEVIIIINSHAESPTDAKQQNEKSLCEAEEFIATHRKAGLHFHILNFPDLPRKHAGVGLARKIGMDEALRRFDQVDQLNEGVIVCYDADCRCDANYLTAIEQHFRAHPKTPGCSIQYEHPLEGDEPPEVYHAIAQYELHLRYYIQAMRFCGLPYAYQTIGSSMAVRPMAYLKQGGMNRRKAGEDFYFLHKIITLGYFTELHSTRVIPSPRGSHRVPFGTGRAINELLSANTHDYLTYSLKSFVDLKAGLQSIPRFHSEENFNLESLPDSLSAFFEEQGFAKAISEIRKNTNSFESFQKRFFVWFDAFKAMKFLHFARDHFYPDAPVEQEARRLYQLCFSTQLLPSEMSVREFLKLYRDWERGG